MCTLYSMQVHHSLQKKNCIVVFVIILQVKLRPCIFKGIPKKAREILNTVILRGGWSLSQRANLIGRTIMVILLVQLAIIILSIPSRGACSCMPSHARHMPTWPILFEGKRGEFKCHGLRAELNCWKTK